DLRQDRAGTVLAGKAEATFEAESIGEGGAFDKHGVVGTGQFVEGLEIVVLPGRQRKAAGLVGDISVPMLRVSACELQFEAIAEAAGNGAFSTEADTAQLVGKAQTVIGNGTWRIDIAEIVLQASAR